MLSLIVGNAIVCTTGMTDEQVWNSATIAKGKFPKWMLIGIVEVTDSGPIVHQFGDESEIDRERILEIWKEGYAVFAKNNADKESEVERLRLEVRNLKEELEAEKEEVKFLKMIHSSDEAD